MTKRGITLVLAAALTLVVLLGIGYGWRTLFGHTTPDPTTPLPTPTVSSVRK